MTPEKAEEFWARRDEAYRVDVIRPRRALSEAYANAWASYEASKALANDGLSDALTSSERQAVLRARSIARSAVLERRIAEAERAYVEATERARRVHGAVTETLARCTITPQGVEFHNAAGRATPGNRRRA